MGHKKPVKTVRPKGAKKISPRKTEVRFCTRKLGHVVRDKGDDSPRLAMALSNRLDALIREVQDRFPDSKEKTRAVKALRNEFNSFNFRYNHTRLDYASPSGRYTVRWDVKNLIKLLNDLAPDFCYFGRVLVETEGGYERHLGFYPDATKLQRAVDRGTVVRVESPEFYWPEDELRERPDVVGVLHVNPDNHLMAYYPPVVDRKPDPVWSE